MFFSVVKRIRRVLNPNGVFIELFRWLSSKGMIIIDGFCASDVSEVLCVVIK